MVFGLGLGLVAAAIYYLAFTLGGIAAEIDRRALLQEREGALIQTGTALLPTLKAQEAQLVSQPRQSTTQTLNPIEFVTDTPLPPSPSPLPPTATASSTQTEVALLSTNTPSPSFTPSQTPSPSPTASFTPSPTATASPSQTELAQLATLIPTFTPSLTLIPTDTPRPSYTPSNTPTPSDTPSPTATATATPTASFTASITPTASDTFTPTMTFTPSMTLQPSTTPYPIEGTYATPFATPIINLPPRAPLVENDPNIVNVVLLGSDSRGENIARTDVMIIVSVNKNTGTVAMWHIPRDLLIYIPGYTVDRVTMAYQIGREGGWPGGGVGMVKEAILYNFGIQIDHHALVNFDDFEQIIEQLGGLQISIDCQIEDWALTTPDADIYLEESYVRYTMRIGRQTLDPYYALWYARSRKGTGDDFDRGRRQMDILRAIFQQSRQAGLLTQVTELYPELMTIVETDMALEDFIEFLPLANNLDLSQIERYSGVLGVHFENFLTPDDGRAVLLPNYAELYQLAQDFVTPPTGNRLDRTAVSIEVYDVSAFGIGFDLVAADRLAWEGFRVFPGGQVSGVRRDGITVYDYTGETKGSALERILEILRVGPDSVVFQPDPNRTVDYRIEIGTSYNSCILGSSADEIEAGPPVPPTPTPGGDGNGEEATPASVG